MRSTVQCCQMPEQPQSTTADLYKNVYTLATPNFYERDTELFRNEGDKQCYPVVFVYTSSLSQRYSDEGIEWASSFVSFNSEKGMKISLFTKKKKKKNYCYQILSYRNVTIIYIFWFKEREKKNLFIYSFFVSSSFGLLIFPFLGNPGFQGIPACKQEKQPRLCTSGKGVAAAN